MRILLTGATGQLGPYIARRLLRDGHEIVLWSHAWVEPVEGITPRNVNLENERAIRDAFAEASPDAVVHAAAMSQISACHADPAKAHRINVEATLLLASLGARIPLIYLSTDLVFDGEQGCYRESDQPNPSNVYGRTKREGETRVLAHECHTVLRLPLIVGPSLIGRPKFLEQLLASLREGKPITLFDDEWRTPLGAADAAEAVALALKHRVAGLLHVAGPQRLSRYEIGILLAKAAGFDASCIRRASRLSMASSEPRPRDTSLCGDKWNGTFPFFSPSSIDSCI